MVYGLVLNCGLPLLTGYLHGLDESLPWYQDWSLVGSTLSSVFLGAQLLNYMTPDTKTKAGVIFAAGTLAGVGLNVGGTQLENFVSLFT